MTSNYIQNGGQGIISEKLLKSWFNSLNFIMEIKNNKSRVFSSEREKKKDRIVESRVKSVKSAIDSDQEDIIQQMNEKNKKEKEKVIVN